MSNHTSDTPPSFPLPSSIGRQCIYQESVQFKKVVNGIWGYLRPLCENPIEIVGDEGGGREISLFRYFCIRRYSNGNWESCDGDKDFDLASKENLKSVLRKSLKFMDWDSVTYKLCNVSDLQYYFPELGSDAITVAFDQAEAISQTWHAAKNMVIDELLKLPGLRYFNDMVIKALGLNVEAVRLTQHFCGRVTSDLYSTGLDQIQLLRKFSHSSPRLRFLIFAFLHDGNRRGKELLGIDLEEDIFLPIWAYLKKHATSKGD